MTSEFVYVTATGPGRKFEMTIPVAHWWDALSALASVMPADMTWNARPVEDIDLRKADEVSGSSSRPREPEAVEGGRELVQPSATGARPGEESQPSDPARPPSPPPNPVCVEASLLVQALPKDSDEYVRFMREKGYSFTHSNWTEDQARHIILFCESEHAAW